MSSLSLRVLGLIGIFAWLAAGCGSSSSNSCQFNSDCKGFQVCTMGTCGDGCHTSEDCPAGQSCVTAADQTKICQLPSETNCAFNTDCPAPLICAVDQRCRNQCQVSVDCPSGQICTTAQTCAEPSEVDPNNNLPGSVGGASGSDGAAGATGGCPVGAETCPCFANYTCNAGLTCASNLCVRLGAGDAGGGKVEIGGACILNSDCNSPLVCSMGRCHDVCHTSADCPAGQSCIAASDQSRVCQLPIETQCAYTSDCQTPLICAVDQRCRNQCQTNVDCPSGQTCTTTKTCANPSEVDSSNNLIVPDGGVSG